MSVAELLALEWKEHEGNPLIAPLFPSPIIADPTFLPPQETPDGLWHLFAHSMLGIHHFTSRDGLEWDILEREPMLKPGSGWKKGFVCALDVRRVGDRFFLYFNARDGWLAGRENIGLALGTKARA